MIIVNGFQPIAIIKKGSILDVAAALNPPLLCYSSPKCYCLLNFVLAWYVVYNIANTIYQDATAIINFTVFHYGFGCTTGKLNLKYMIPLQYLTTSS